MALLTTNAALRPQFAILGAPLRAVGRFFVRVMENNSRVQSVERLNALSDEALARKGLKREDIVHHVFKDIYFI